MRLTLGADDDCLPRHLLQQLRGEKAFGMLMNVKEHHASE